MKISKRTFLLTAVTILGLAVIVFQRAVKYSQLEPESRQTPAVPAKTSSPSAEIRAALDAAERSVEDWRSGRKFDRKRLDEALATGNPSVWMPIIGEMINPIYRREEAIGILVSLLDDSGWSVRYQAARQLLQLGSTVGIPVLQAAIGAAAKGEKVPEEIVTWSASTLHQFRHAIDGAALFVAYERMNRPLSLQRILIMQQVPEMREIVREKLARGELGFETGWMGAYLNMHDPESIAHYTQLSNAVSNRKAQLLGKWALYRATGDAKFLDYVVSTAREAAGLDPKTDKSQPWTGNRELAFEFLRVTVEPAATNTLREIADFAALKSGNTDDFGRAFSALFYLHGDNAFVDKRVMEYLRGGYSGDGVDGRLLMQIAAARDTQEFREAAVAKSSLFYQQVFIHMRGRPVENWIDLSYVPRELVPPLAGRSN